MRNLCHLGFAGLLLVIVLSACGDPRPSPVAVNPVVFKSMERYKAEYVLAPGDQVEVTVLNVPEASHASIVRPDGYISLPMVKDVKAVGLTVPELTKELTQRYGQRLVEPDVTVAVGNPREASVYVVGEVTRPGPIPIRTAPTVAMAVASSGGVPKTADLDNVAIIRLNDDGYLTGNVIERQNTGQAAFYAMLAATPLKAGDIVVIPESGRSQFVRFVQDYINTPLSGLNSLLTPYFQFKIIRGL